MKAPQFSETWSDDFKALYNHDVQEIWDRTIAPHIWNQYHNQLDLYKKIAGQKPVKILDVGCAQATLALLLAEQGHDVTAVDIRPSFLEYAKSRYTHGKIKFLASNILKDEIPDKYDLIYANQIIEHLVYPEELISKLKACLKPNGKIVVTTPNFQYIKNDLPSFKELGDPKQWEHMQFSADGDGHFYAYSKEELIQIFRSVGFEDIEVTPFESPFISGHLKIRFLHYFVPVNILKVLDFIVTRNSFIKYKLSFQLMISAKQNNAINS